MKRLLILLLLVFSVSSLAQEEAKDVDITVESIVDQVTANDVASFDLRIGNNLVRDSDFFVAKNFYSDKWRVTADPYILSVQSGYSRNTKLSVYPLSSLSPGNYNLVINVKSRDGTFSEDVPITVQIIPFGEENVKTDLIIDDKVDPRLGVVARVKLENLFNYEIKNVKIILTSELFELEREIDLEANERRVEKFTLDFPDDVELKDYVVNVKVKTELYLLGGANKRITLAPYSEVTEKIFRSNAFNKKIVVSKENTGTEKSVEEIKLELTTFERLLARFNVYPDLLQKVGGNYVASWSFELDPGDKKEIVVTLPYGTYLLVLLVVVLLIYILLYITKSKVVLIKRIIDVGKDQEGIRDIKIVLHLINKGNKALHKIRIIDYLPKMIAASSKDFGTMRPSKVQRSLDGRMRLIWDLDGLDRGEERIISYIAKSKLSIIGKLSLSNAVVEYHSGRRYIHVHSNKLTLFTEASGKEKRS